MGLPNDMQKTVGFGLGLFALAFGFSAWGYEPAGYPGTGHFWGAARKDAVLTAYEKSGAASPVWATLSEGVVTEVFYPTVDFPQTADLQYIVVSPTTGFWEQRRDGKYQVQYIGDGFQVEVTTEDRNGQIRFLSSIVTDSKRAVLRIKTKFEKLPLGAKVFLVWKPSMNNDGFKTIGWTSPGSLNAKAETIFRNEPVFATLKTMPAFKTTSLGYFGVSDPWQQLKQGGNLNPDWDQTRSGSISLGAEVNLDSYNTVELALGFGPTATASETASANSLSEGFGYVSFDYQLGWLNYRGEIQKTATALSALSMDPVLWRSIQILKTHEDKRNRGAQVAALCKPGIPTQNYSQDNIGGYHLVWPRDLYHSAIGLLAAGDTQTPVDTLTYLSKIQKKDGSWWQNFFMDGTPYWKAVQMDQVAFPILLAKQLSDRGLIDPKKYESMVKSAADFLVSAGSWTEQDRWEEIGGFSPHSIAAQVAGLKAAADLLSVPAYDTAAIARAADLEKTTLVKKGPWGSHYFLRISQTGVPADGSWIKLANGGHDAPANSVIDGGYLDLVRLNVRAADDSAILNTNAIYLSQALGLSITKGPGLVFGRYNGDRYGQGQSGGFWPLLAGEWGEYQLIAGDAKKAAEQWSAMAASANPAGIIPEQLMRDGSTGLGVPAPLAWSHAQFIRLRRSILDGRVFDRPTN
ncbi:MAG: hypothetical protein JNL01_02615 [Bdellovibrionales bacterium]|nr:hypothetical protein [Bdellovibrionales bacterium]